MARVKIVLTGNEFSAEKWFEWSNPPVVDENLFIKLRENGGYAVIKIKFVNHYVEEDAYEARCTDALNAICNLYIYGNIDDNLAVNNGKWKMKKYLEFELDPTVIKAIARMNEDRKKYANQ
jgi:hypothetical protein